jgi:predicted nucleotidyltransferase
MNRLLSLDRQRTAERLRTASDCARRIVDAAALAGVEMSVVGSLARNAFRQHSDLDLLVRGRTTPHRRAMVERLVADHMRGTDIPYDLIFEDDLSAARLKELLDDLV